MAGVNIATAYVELIPSFQGIQGAAATGFAPVGQQAQQAGQQAGSSFADEFGAKLKAGIAAAGIGLSFAAAMQDGQSTAKLQAQLDLTTEQAARAGKVAGELYTSNYGESRDDVKDVLREIGTSIGDLSSFTDAELKSTAGKAFSLANVMGEETGRVVQNAGRLIKTGLASDVDEAFDLMTAASQRTSGELQADMIDVVNEYAPQFQALGLSGEEAFNLITAASKDGAIEMDKTGDALKEFGIRATDMSTTSQAAYATLGLSAKDMSDRLLAGGDTANKAFQEIVAGLQSIEDPTEKANTAIALFGTPIEDLGVQKIPLFIDRLASASDGLGDFAGKADEVDKTMGETAAGGFESFMRKLEAVGLGLGQDLLPKLEPVLEFAGEAGAKVGDLAGWFTSLPAPIQSSGLALAGLVAMRGRVTSMATSIGTGLNNIATGATSAGSSFGSMAGTVGRSVAKGGAFVLAAVAIGAVASAIMESGKESAAAEADVAAYVKMLVDAGGKLDEVAQKELDVGYSQTPAFRQLMALGADYRDLLDGINGDSEAFIRVQMQVADAGIERTGVALADVQRLAARIAEAKEQTARIVAAQQFDEFQTGMSNAKATAGQFLESLKTGPVADFAGALIDAAVNGGKVGDALEFDDLTIPLGPLTSLVDGLRDAADEADDTRKALSDWTITAPIGPLGEFVGAVMAAETEVRTMNKATATQAREAHLAKESLEAWGDAFPAVGSTLGAVSDAATELGEQVSFARLELDKLAGHTPTVEQSMAALYDQIDAMNQQWDPMQEGVQKLSDSALNADGSLNLANDNARAFYATTMDLRDATLEAAAAASANALETGGSLVDAQNAAAVAAELGTQEFIKQAMQIGLTDGQARTLAASYGLLKEPIVTSITANTSQAMEAIGILRGALAAIPGLSVVSAGLSFAAPKHADGGLFRGFGGPRDDANLTWISDKEFIVNANSTMKHLPLLEAINADKFAGGGLRLPSAAVLAGVPAVSRGQREGAIFDALAEVAGVLDDAAENYRDARADARQDFKDVQDAKRDARGVRAAEAERVASAEEKLVGARKNQAERVGDAEQRLAAARARRDSKGQQDAKAIADAEKNLGRIRAEQAEAVKDAATGLQKATSAQEKSNQAAEAKVKTAEREYDLSKAQAEVARQNAVAGRAAYEQQERARRALVALGREYDRTSAAYEKSVGRLGQLRSDRNAMASSIADGLAGSGGGILGFADKRTTIGSFLKGQDFNADNIERFGKQIATLDKKGLSSNLLAELAKGGVDNAGPLVQMLAGASKSEIAKFNAEQRRIDAASSRIGKYVANDSYGPAIDKAAKATDDLREEMVDLRGEMKKQAGNIERAIEKGLDKATLKMDPNGLWRVVRQGQSASARRG